jgi:hypothetical protein
MFNLFIFFIFTESLDRLGHPNLTTYLPAFLSSLENKTRLVTPPAGSPSFPDEVKCDVEDLLFSFLHCRCTTVSDFCIHHLLALNHSPLPSPFSSAVYNEYEKTCVMIATVRFYVLIHIYIYIYVCVWVCRNEHV